MPAEKRGNKFAIGTSALIFHDVTFFKVKTKIASVCVFLKSRRRGRATYQLQVWVGVDSQVSLPLSICDD